MMHQYPLYDVEGEDKQKIIIPLEYADESLVNIIKYRQFKNIKWTYKELLLEAKHLLEGLSSLHKNGISHCDIKPSNILHSKEDNCLKYSDFGISLKF